MAFFYHLFALTQKLQALKYFVFAIQEFIRIFAASKMNKDSSYIENRLYKTGYKDSVCLLEI